MWISAQSVGVQRPQKGKPPASRGRGQTALGDSGRKGEGTGTSRGKFKG